MNKTGTHCQYTETQGDSREEESRAHPFAHHVARNFEEDVGDVENGEGDIEVVAFHFEVFFETGQFRISCNA